MRCVKAIGINQSLVKNIGVGWDDGRKWSEQTKETHDEEEKGD